MSRLAGRKTRWGPLLLMCMTVGTGCGLNPLQRSYEDELRERLLNTRRSYRNALADAQMVRTTRTLSELEQELGSERRAQLDEIGGPKSHEGVPLKLDKDLMGNTDVRTIVLSLRQALHLAVKNNLDIQLAQLQPALRDTTLVQAEAFFDAVYFLNFNFQKLDTPLPATNPLVSTAFGTVQEDTRAFDTGIRKELTRGGRLTISSAFGRNHRDPSFFSTRGYYDANILATLEQPLLRGFGEDINRAQIILIQNAKTSDVEELRQNMNQVVNDTETTYWNLVAGRQQLLIRQRLFERTSADRDKIKQRLMHDAEPVQYTQAQSSVWSARADVIRARNLLANTSDSLKRLINSPDVNLADEVLIVPADSAASPPVEISLLDAVTTALRRRPEMKQSLLDIQDSSIRQRVADNARLPQLDIIATARFNGVGETVGDAQNVVTHGDFIDYLLGLQFEVPIGNRGPEAFYRQRQIERRAAVIAYQSQAQQVVLDVKISLRRVIDAFELIGATLVARLAAADNVRALDEKEKAGGDPNMSLTQLVDLRLRRLEALANAEEAEIQALAAYHISIANLHLAMGTILGHNAIEFSNQPVED